MPVSILPTSRRVRLLLAGFAAVVVLVLTYAAGVVSAGFYAPGENSPEAGFVRDMSVHHAQAVEMGMLAYQRATNPEVRHEGYDIALTQQSQIGAMKSWLDKWRVSRASSTAPMSWMPGGKMTLASDGRMPGMASHEELTKLNTVTGKDFDILFCQLMIRHHLGGIHMAEEIVKVSDNADVRSLAEAMKAGQQGEITIFNNLLTSMGAKPM
ncbi:DUF305 domain-containing protein [Planosporangium flavigriseum]|uniref:DUF305 domain-containing protein n=1 Tax=Planosporangium flavigriseum TaxID=373681 RepID=A0A8J3PNJ4_9ACTN|nr:DUF305 domain-containing protein [Planosporangium flavigriseum]NJC67768.1 DUF305 domain-containing protein [Planosporangium flavigriseum]GIG76067.1 DUF305 domain-containing protein [Planosporangium flavigriseum]